MANPINTETMLIEEGALLPESLRFESEAWTPFYMAGEIKATIFGFDVQKSKRPVSGASDAYTKDGTQSSQANLGEPEARGI